MCKFFLHQKLFRLYPNILSLYININSNTYPAGMGVDVADISGKVEAHYPRRPD
jgi:hypothetical protein